MFGTAPVGADNSHSPDFEEAARVSSGRPPAPTGAEMESLQRDKGRAHQS
jgi:hypothetical protein